MNTVLLGNYCYYAGNITSGNLTNLSPFGSDKLQPLTKHLKHVISFSNRNVFVIYLLCNYLLRMLLFSFTLALLLKCDIKTCKIILKQRIEMLVLDEDQTCCLLTHQKLPDMDSVLICYISLFFFSHHRGP